MAMIFIREQRKRIPKPFELFTEQAGLALSFPYFSSDPIVVTKV